MMITGCTCVNRESVQKAWPLLKKLLDNTPYRSRVELTINQQKQLTNSTRLSSQRRGRFRALLSKVIWK